MSPTLQSSNNVACKTVRESASSKGDGLTTRLEAITRPKSAGDYKATTRHLNIGYGVAALGLMMAMITLIANIAAANSSDPQTAAETLAWSFGLTTMAFGTIKFGIGIVLIGILIRLWIRVESVKVGVGELKPDGDGQVQTGTIKTSFGAATTGATVPKPLPIHKMARTMWAPMLAMGYMLVIVGLIVSFVWSANIGTRTGSGAQAWTAGLQFLGEGFLLAGISFLLGSILASLREGGGQVQESLGLTVKTLKMPTTAKVFVGLMTMGVMLAVLQFVLYMVVIYGEGGERTLQSFQAWLAWLGPLREVSLGLLLAGVVMALVTIGNVLDFQFDRIKSMIKTGN